MIVDTPLFRHRLLQQIAYGRMRTLLVLAGGEEADQETKDAYHTIDFLLDILDTEGLERVTKSLLRPLFEHGDTP